MEKVVTATVMGQEMVERRNRALIFCGLCGFIYILLALSPPASTPSTCFVTSLRICLVTATPELLVCITSSYVHDSLPPIGGESNSGSTRSFHWEAESSGRTTIECFVFGIGIGIEIAVRHSEWWAGWCRWDVCLACRVETAVGIHSGFFV